MKYKVCLCIIQTHRANIQGFRDNMPHPTSGIMAWKEEGEYTLTPADVRLLLLGLKGCIKLEIHGKLFHFGHFVGREEVMVFIRDKTKDEEKLGTSTLSQKLLEEGYTVHEIWH